MFISSAVSGTTIEPVIRNSSTSIASRATPSAYGRPAFSFSVKSSSTAASPVTQDR